MGAVTSIFQAARDPSIAGMVLDSPFSNLNQLSLELAKTHTNIPGFIAKIVQKLIRSSIKSRTNLDINHLSPLDHAPNCFSPALFVVAKGDDFVRPHHGEALLARYAGDKNLLRVEGDHNSERPSFMMDSAAIFFHNTLQCDQLPADPFAEELPAADFRRSFRVDRVFEQQRMQNQKEKLLLEVQRSIAQGEDEEFKQALFDSVESLQDEKLKERRLDQFFYQLEHCWRDKENLDTILDKELGEMDAYFNASEKDSIRSLALQRRNSMSSLNGKRQAKRPVLGEVNFNVQSDDEESGVKQL